MNFLDNLFFAFWFFLPAGLANIAASLSGVVPKLRELSYPMDFYKTFRRQRIFGEHKTIRGLLIGTITAILIVYVQKIAYSSWQLEFPIDYDFVDPVWLGFLLGVGALLGDAIKSFFKRQFNIAPGDSLLFFDQIDYIVGGILFSLFYTRLNPVDYLYIAGLYFILHFLVNIIGYLLGIRAKAA